MPDSWPTPGTTLAGSMRSLILLALCSFARADNRRAWRGDCNNAAARALVL